MFAYTPGMVDPDEGEFGEKPPFNVMTDGYEKTTVLDDYIYTDTKWSRRQMERLYVDLAMARIPATRNCLDYEPFRYAHLECQHYYVDPEGNKRKLRQVKLIDSKVEVIGEDESWKSQTT